MKKDEFPVQILVATLIIAISFLALKSELTTSYSFGPNYENVSVDTIVNITQAFPEIISVIIDQSLDNFTLNAGLTKKILCNITVRDFNGWNDTKGVNATFWDDNDANMNNPDDNNNHYTDSTCVLDSNDGQYISMWNCTFDIEYYANNGSNWICNATAIDEYNFTVSESATTTMNALYALNLTTLIDFGDMAVEDTSTTEQANITNFGNMDINISLYGYGVTPNDGLAFDCDIGNITIDNERHSLVVQAWSLMTNLTSAANNINNLTLAQRTDDTTPVINTTYWRLYIPPNPFGNCTGNIVFQAELP